MFTQFLLLSALSIHGQATPSYLAGNPLSHGSRITKLIYLPNEDLVASTGTDGWLKIWNLRTKKLVTERRISTDPIVAASLVERGTCIAMAGSGRKIHLFDLKAGKVVKTLNMRWSVAHLSFSEANRWLAYSLLTGEIGIINLESGKLIAKRQINTGQSAVDGVSCVFVDGQTLAFVEDGNLCRWNISNDSVASTKLRAAGSVIGYSQESADLLVACDEDAVDVYRLTGKEVRHIKQIDMIDDSATAAAWFPQKGSLAIGCSSGCVRLLRNRDFELRSKYTFYPGSVDAICLSPGDWKMAIGGAGNYLDVLSIDGDMTDRSGSESRGPINGVSFAENEQFIVTAGADGFVRVWDIARMREYGRMRMSSKPMMGIAGLKNSFHAFSWDRYVYSFDFVEMQAGKDLLRVHSTVELGMLPLSLQAIDRNEFVWVTTGADLRWSARGDKATGDKVNLFVGIVAAPKESRVYYFDQADDLVEQDTRNNRNVLLQGVKLPTANLAASDTMVVCASSRNILVYDKVLKMTKTLSSSGRMITRIAVSSDSAKVAAADSDGSVFIWNLKTDQKTQHQRVHFGRITDVRFDRAGSFCVTCSEDNSIAILRCK